MAKGSSNNPRGKTSDASKPYDVSNSFVKRVASRVSELLPQPTWLSRWMSPAAIPNAGDLTNHTLSSTITSRPPATSRAELNLVDDDIDHQNPAKKPRTSRYHSPINNKFLKTDLYGAEDLSPIPLRGEPVAGPSTAQNEFIASTPAVAVQQTSNKVNGDDCSETSESTSGCSSLVPQAQSTIRSLGGSSRLGRMAIPHGTSIDSVHRKRPSFSTTTFASPLRSSMRERLGSSPFYSGHTMYGGSAQAYLSTVHSPQRRVGPTVKPAPAQQQSLPLSSTAKRILDALEQFSTPCIDAKRMPVVGSKRKLESGSRRYAELSIPTTPDLLRVKRREQLQQSTSAARQTATASSPLSPLSTAPPSPDYSIRKEDTESKKHTGKVRAKAPLADDKMVEVNLPAVVLPLDNLPKIDIAIPPPPPASPVSSTARKFVFSPPATVASLSSVSPVAVPAPAFTFRPPASDSDVSVSDKQLSRTDKNSSSCGEVNTSSTLSYTPVPSESANFKSENKATQSCKTCQVKIESIDGSCSACQKNASTSGDSSLKDSSVCSCKNLTTCPLCVMKNRLKTFDSNKNNIQPSLMNFGGFSTKQSGTWECTTCLIRNKQDTKTCVACCSTKPEPKPSLKEVSSSSKVSEASAVTTTSTSGFGDKFKQPAGSWECESCMVRNKPDTSTCVACETPKSGSKSTSQTKAEVKIDMKTPVTEKGFGDLFKKASGSWCCDECLITNDADKVKCVACETVKPGATVPDKPKTSAPQFSFGIPTSATSNSSAGTTFSFGINKIEQPKTAQKSTFNSQIPIPSQTFSFGIPKTEKDSSSGVSSSTSTKPLFQFGSSATSPITSETNKTDSKNVSSNATPLNITPTVSKPDTLAKPENSVLSSSVSTPNSNTSNFMFSPKAETTTKEKASTAPLFSFGSNTVNKPNVSSTSIEKTPFSKPVETSFMFGSKQETNFATSTTNTLSSSPSNNIFKFGETKTVTSSGNMSISSVSTQPSYSTPKDSSVFTFGANTEKKQEHFALTATKENAITVNTNTPIVENKPVFNSFAATTNQTTAFGNASTFGSSTFGNKEPPPNPFLPQNATNLFGATQQASTTSAFQTNSFQPPAPQENKPSPVFNFGSSDPKQSAPSTGGFVFKPYTERQPEIRFGFAGASTNPAPAPTGPTFGFNNTANTSSNTFNFEPKPFAPATPFGPASNTAPPLFGGVNTPQSVPAFGEQANPPPPVYSFGAQPAQAVQAPANPMFDFGSSQQQNAPVAAAPSTGFVFGATPAPAPAPAQAPPAFDPNMKPTFNFTQGATTTFSAIPTVNPTAPQQAPTRKIRKAVRRTVPSVRQT